MNDSFWTEYSALLSRLMPPLAPGDGVPEAQLEGAEADLGWKVPGLLREFYLLTGQRDDINDHFHTLYSPHFLVLRPRDDDSWDDVLVFYESEYSVILWGIDPRSDDPDPPVLRAENVDPLDWEPEFDHLSQFLMAMLLLQSVTGGMPYGGLGTAPRDRIASAEGWQALDVGGNLEHWGNRVRLRDGQVLFIVGDDPGPTVYGGGRTREDFLAVQGAFDISWEYSTLDGEEYEDDENDSDEED